MTQENHAAVGKAFQERSYYQVQEQALRKRAYDLCDEYEKAAKALREKPESLGFHDEHSEMYPRYDVSVDRNAFGPLLSGLLNEFRANKENITRVNSVLKIPSERDYQF